MEHGACASVIHDLYVDLSLSENEIFSKMKKSVRNSIYQGERLWETEVHSVVSNSLFDEFRLLHLEVAGRVTRSLESWNLQKKAIDQGKGFLVTQRNESGLLIGAALFSVSRGEGSYDVAAFRRNLFDKPVSHVVQWKAIRYMKKLGLRWYFIGSRFYPGDLHVPTEKELHIAEFKEKFATDMFPRLITDNDFRWCFRK